MATWDVDDDLAVELDDLTEVAVSLIGGDLSVKAAEGVARLEVQRQSGEPVRVRFEGGVLRVTQEQSSRLFRRETSRASVVLTCHPDVRLGADTVSAGVFIDGLAPPVRVQTVSGEAVLTGLGEVDVESTSGAIEVLGIAGTLHARSVSGSVSVAQGRSPEVEARSTSGEIVLDLEPAPGGRYSCETVSGSVAVRIPASASARVDATSISGQLDNTFGLTSERSSPAQRRMSGAIGAGDAELRLRTVSGAVTLLHRDGSR